MTVDPPLALDAGEGPPRADPLRAGPSLLRRLSIANGSVLAVALVLLTFTPIVISAPIEIDQFLLLLAGFGLLLALNLFLLRRVLSPLRRLTELMRSVEPDRPGQRLDHVALHDAEVVALASAFNDMLDRLEVERRESARVALAAQEQERLRVAQELHDEIGQSLTAVTLDVERAAESGPANPTADLHRIADDIRSSLDDVRRIARELRPEALDDLGLVNALITLCSRVSAQGGLPVERRLETGLPPLDSDVELVVYRVAQESLTNVVRHAGAKRASVLLQTDEGTLTLCVRDDGRGLPAELPKDAAGIGGMRERARLVGGRLTITSLPGRGTTVKLELSLDRAGVA